MSSEFRKFEAELKEEMARLGKEWAEEIQSAREIILQRKASREAATRSEKVKVPPLNTPENGNIQIMELDKDTFRQLRRQSLHGRKGVRRLKSDTSFMLNGHSIKDLEPRPFAHSPFWCLAHGQWFSECAK